jgi:hypothetical protein
VSDTSRMVPASVFLLWWQRLLELKAEASAAEASAGDNPANLSEVGALLDVLHDVGKRNGAIHDSLTTTGYGAESTSSFGSFDAAPIPDFDWQAGEIDFALGHPYVTVDPEEAIAEIIRVTGIKEHDAEDIPPMVERQQRDT